MKYAGIDYGARRIGIALSDDEGHIAFPHTVVANNRATLPLIGNLIEKEHIQHVVVGDGLSHNGRTNAVTAEIRAWGAALARDVSIPVSYQSEYFTSEEASRPLTVRRGRTTRNTRHQVCPKDGQDAIAAALILQRFLDKHPSLLRPQP